MIYPIDFTGKVGAPLRYLQENFALDMSRSTEERLRVLFRVGNTKFYVDQSGDFYYLSDGAPQYNGYNGELSGFGYESVEFDRYTSPRKIGKIGYTNISYDNRSECVSRIGDVSVYYKYADEIDKVGGLSFTFDYGHQTRNVNDVLFTYEMSNNYKNRIRTVSISSRYYDTPLIDLNGCQINYSQRRFNYDYNGELTDISYY